MSKEKKYIESEKLINIVQEEANEKIRVGYKIPDVISAYTCTTARLLAVMVLTNRMIGNTSFDEEEFINTTAELIKNTIKDHVDNSNYIADKMREILNN